MSWAHRLHPFSQQRRREPHVVIIELKQREEVSQTAQDGLVQTFLGGGIRTTSHQLPGLVVRRVPPRIQRNGGTLEGTQPCAFLLHRRDGRARQALRRSHGAGTGLLEANVGPA